LKEERALEAVTCGAVFARLPAETQARISSFSAEELREGVARNFARPMPRGRCDAAPVLMNPCLAVQWLAAFEELKLPRTSRIYEPCAWASEPVILAADIYSGGQAEYVSLNLNRPLAAQLREKLGSVGLRWEILEEPAQAAAEVLVPESFDVACFHHAINDLLQTAVAEPRGMDTRTVDWGPNERRMIEWLAEEAAAGELDRRARPGLLTAVEQAARIVRPGGWLLFDHRTWLGHADQPWFPWELFCAMIPLARDWIAAADLPLTEVPLAGRDPQWWMCYRRG